MLNLLGPAPSQHLPSNDDTGALKRIIGPVSVVARGRDVCAADSKRVHLLLDGWAAKYRYLDRARRQFVSVHLSGEVCDLDRLFCPDVSYGVHALTECRVASIAVDDLRALVDDNASIRNLFWSMTVLENVALVEQVINLGSRPARERVAHFLCDLYERLQPRGAMYDRTFRLRLTQSELAEFLGLSVVHTNRTLRALSDDKIIRTQGSNYTILDLARLKAVAGGRNEATEGIAWRQYETSNVLRTSIQGPLGIDGQAGILGRAGISL